VNTRRSPRKWKPFTKEDLPSLQAALDDQTIDLPSGCASWTGGHSNEVPFIRLSVDGFTLLATTVRHALIMSRGENPVGPSRMSCGHWWCVQVEHVENGACFAPLFPEKED
jgi:hypothetical protein